MTGTDHAALGAELSALLKLAAPPIGIAFRETAETPGVAPVGRRAAGADRGRAHRRGAGALRLLVPGDRPGVLHRRRRPRQLQRRQLHPRLQRLAEVADKADVAALVAVGLGRRGRLPARPGGEGQAGLDRLRPARRAAGGAGRRLPRLNPKQAMVLDDALGGVRFEGKPQCHVLAIAKDARRDGDQRRLHAEPGAHRDGQRRDVLRHPGGQARPRRSRRSGATPRPSGRWPPTPRPTRRASPADAR